MCLKINKVILPGKHTRLNDVVGESEQKEPMFTIFFDTPDFVNPTVFGALHVIMVVGSRS